MEKTASRWLWAAGLLAACGNEELPATEGSAGVEITAQACPSPAVTPKWEVTASAGSRPSTVATQMVYDSRRKRLVVLDPGLDMPGATWEHDGTGWTQVAAPDKSPPGRSGFALAYDSARGKVVLFGGRRTSAYHLDDTWEWDGTSWQKIAVTGTVPIRRGGHRMVYDTQRRRTVLFGGSNGAGPLSDTWKYDGTRWTEAKPATQPPARVDAAMAYDEARGRLVMYGGIGAGSAWLSDTWEYNGTAWRPMAVGAQKGSLGVAMAYDSVRQRVVAFGGDYSLGPGPTYQSDETWEYDGTGWQEIPIPGGIRPPDRTNSMMAFDAARGRIVLYGGYYRYDSRLWSYYHYVEPNRPPRLGYALSDQQVFANDTLTFTIKATDPDGNPLTYSATGLPAGATVNPTTGEVRLAPTPMQAGSYAVQVTASDGCLSDTKTFNLTVLHVTYPGFPTGAVDMRVGYLNVPSVYEDCSRTTGCTTSRGNSSVSCKIQGQNPGKLVASCESSAFTTSWNPYRPSGSAPIGPDQRFLLAGSPPVTLISGLVEQRGADAYLVVTDMTVRWNQVAKTYSTGSVSALLAPYP